MSLRIMLQPSEEDGKGSTIKSDRQDDPPQRVRQKGKYEYREEGVEEHVSEMAAITRIKRT